MNTLFIGRNMVELDAVDSTNNYAKSLLSNSKPTEGTVILAHEQFAGRGQAGSSWQTAPGLNITLSIILYPARLEAVNQFYLSMAIALGVKDFCETLVPEEFKIKWPNDVFHNNSKVAGILIENTIASGSIQTSVVGIGINLNQQTFSEDLPHATSLGIISQKTFNLTEAVGVLCACIEKYYLQLRQQHFNFLDKAYMVALYRYQQTHHFKKGNQIIKGEINGVAKDGKLILHVGGKEQRFAFKEIEYVL